MLLKATAKALQASATLDPAAFVGVTVPYVPKVPIAIGYPTGTVMAELNAWSLRKVVALVAEVGADAVSVVVQGKIEGAALVEAGISAVLK